MTRTTTRTATAMRTTAVALAALGAVAMTAACGVEVVDEPGTAGTAREATSAADAPTSDAPSSEAPATESEASGGLAPVTLPPGATWLYDVEHQGGTAGAQQSVVFDDVELPHGTAASVACDGTLSETVFDLGGRYDLLTGNIVIGDHAPRDIAVRVYLVLDDADLDAALHFTEGSQAYARYGQGQPLDGVADDAGAFDALVSGGQQLSVITMLEEGTCTPGDAPYITFAETYLTPAG